MFVLRVNGRDRRLDVDGATPLLWALRDHLGLTATKYGCGAGACGACTVHLDGEPVRSCSITVADASGRSVTTLEGSQDRIAQSVRKAWRKLDVVQCGYCQPGQIMAAIALLRQKPRPTDSEIDAAMDGNLCRCATYQRIRAAIHDAAAGLGS
ncbi:MAG TPA: (2Fe-2S)-binding protein [Rhodospirillaceae bacterium]|nr:(2Fe-2S)-binding protein [Rhodospirillaceae bacterium]